MYTVILEDEIIDNLNLEEAEDIAKIYAESEDCPLFKRAKWCRGLYQLDYMRLDENGAKIIVVSIEKSE